MFTKEPIHYKAECTGFGGNTWQRLDQGEKAESMLAAQK